jgi:predicted 2-oxoglutarate/Fe(II)-dependent dioxygenase YbiX
MKVCNTTYKKSSRFDRHRRNNVSTVNSDSRNEKSELNSNLSRLLHINPRGKYKTIFLIVHDTNF